MNADSTSGPSFNIKYGCGGRGPMLCAFPHPRGYRWNQKWTCRECGTTYRRGRKVRKHRWYRNWTAENGYWRWPLHA